MEHHIKGSPGGEAIFLRKTPRNLHRPAPPTAIANRLPAPRGMDSDDVFEELQEPREGNDVDLDTEQSPDIVSTDIVATDLVADSDEDSENVLQEEEAPETDREDDGNSSGSRLASPLRNTRIEVAIPEMTFEKRSEYMSIRSEIVEFVARELAAKRGHLSYEVEFTDGREDVVTFSDLITLDNGKAALYRFGQGPGLDATRMTGPSRKRKRFLKEDSDSDLDSVVSDPMDVDDEDELNVQPVQSRRESSRLGRSLRSRDTSRQNSHNISNMSDDDPDDLEEQPSAGRTRTLRTRQPKQTTLTAMSFKNSFASQDQDELAADPQAISTDEEDGDFALVTSDVTPKAGRPSKARQMIKRSKQMRLLRSKAKAQKQYSWRQKSHDSDIEFEAPRRSARATRNKVNMQDDALMDDDSFYVVDDKIPTVAKVISVREVFQAPPSDSAFVSMHLTTCHTCGGSKQRGQLIYCQGCTLSYHKNCIGYRSAREHLATKVGEDNFVLQCRFCIGIYNKKDVNAPKHSKCQGCADEGRACHPFSEKKTSRQEEKLREQNDGVDPITPVSAELLNNADLVLFRCVKCHRGWHVKHLPGSDVDADFVDTDLRSERLKDYSIDWQCLDCGTVKNKIHRLVAWRPIDRANEAHRPSYSEVNEDSKEYLVKWENNSYAHCTWVPGAWVFGFAPSTMRTSFAKRDIELDLLRFTTEEAVPNEFVMADVILNVNMRSDASFSRGKSREAELANISKISKIFVKFQGLGYDDVVWDSPPTPDSGEIYSAFVEAYYEYVEGKCFQSEPQNRIRERIKSFKASPFVEVEEQPAGLKRGKLMGYQLEGLNWLLENYHDSRSVVLADEMGLGKTVQVVSLVASLVQDKPKIWPYLIVVPNATCPNWRREFKQWAPDLRVVTYHGGKEPQELAYKYELFPNNSADMKAHVVIMSYDSAQDPRTMTLFKPVNWAGLVVDEGQRLKNDQNLLYGALRSMKIPFRLLLTGTPLQNNKRELFNLLQFIDETQDAAKLDIEYQVLDKETLPMLHEKIRPYFLRRTKAGVLKFLPPMAQIILPVSMTVIQEKLSKSIMAKNPELIKSMFANSKMNKKERGSLNNILMQLRKCLCHPFVYSNAIEERNHDSSIIHRNLVEASAKLILMEIMLPKLKARGHRVLIFSQFLNQLDIVEDFLSGIGCEFRRLDGQIGSLEKQRRIDAFNAPDSSIFAFLLSTRAGGVGINLATADTVIIMDPDFNPHQDLQALSRAHRIGQKNKVLCFQLMTKDSVEERIMQVGRKKMALDHALIESMDDEDLAGDDLESILKHGAQALFSDDYQKSAIVYDDASVDKLLDRTQMEQAKTDDEVTQFSYARVWANDKSGFKDGLAAEEEHEPLPINSSVWDSILAKREEEARREAEANREVLGRGGRRRPTINYKNNAVDLAQLGAPDPDSADSSDDFAGADSVDDSDDDRASAKEAQDDPITIALNQAGKAANSENAKARKSKTGEVKLKADTTAEAKARQAQQWQQRQQAKEAAGENRKDVQLIKQERRKAGETTGQNPSALQAPKIPQKRGRKPRAQEAIAAIPRRDPGVVLAGGVIPDYTYEQYMPAHASLPAGPQVLGSSNLDNRPDFKRQLQEHALYQMNGNGLRELSRPALLIDYRFSEFSSEAEVRLALDRVQHSGGTAQAKRAQKTALLEKLRAIVKQNGS
ncbi:hypothetical protein G7046_g6380 [Stylonectria norvegica]|nr:hypothetical protein G7046_g6380 [Stylonectria norvegica]